MRVSNSMYGLPGKCIACRLKIRLPRADEVPAGSNEIHLKDFPQLIRTPKSKKQLKQETDSAQHALDSVPKKPTSDGEPTPVTELDIADSAQVSREHVVGSIPLDPMESLQQLESLGLKIERYLKVLDNSKDKNLRAEYKGHQQRINQARNELDEQMRQLLMEVAIELSNTQEKISEVQISARVAEIPLREFQDKVYKLRHRRDRLERRQLNLRGWLAATSPFNVGGYIDVSLEYIPKDGFTLPVPVEAEETSTLLNVHAVNLKRAFNTRKNTERKMNEIKRLGEASNGEEKAHLADTYNTTKGTRRIAKAQIQFSQQRLEQLVHDYENDLETLEAQLQTDRDKLSINQLTRVEFDKFELQSNRTKIDIAKGIGLAKRLIHANSLDDVPDPRGTFLQRLGFSNEDAMGKKIMMVLWAAGILLTLSLFLPSIGNASLLKSFNDFNGTGSAAGLILALPIIAGIATIGLSFLTNPAIRGFALLGLWGTTTLLLAYTINESNFSLDPIANRFRSGNRWILRPGMLAILLADILILLSAIISLSTIRKNALAGLSIGLLTGFFITWIATNGFHSYYPTPTVEDIQNNFSQETKTQSGLIRIQNEGSRILHLVSRRTSALNGYLYTIDRKIGGNSFSEITPEGSTSVGDNAYPDVSVPLGKSLDIEYNLPVGDYRILLISHATNSEIEKAFSVVNPIPTPTPAPVATEPEFIQFDNVQPEPKPTEEAKEISETLPDPEFMGSPLPAVILTGIITRPNGQPTFSLELFTDSETKGVQLQASLNDTLINGWILTEFNPGQSTLTLKKESKYLVLRHGIKVPLNSRAKHTL